MKTSLTLWQRIKDRLFKYDALHGIYMTAFGVAGLIDWKFHQQFSYRDICLLVFIYAIVDGLRRIWHNPYKDAAKLVARRAAYLQAHLPPAPELPPHSQTPGN